ncbi:MAG: respiratory nitrate reductase subunit beta [Pseudomonadales bacterium]|jgi:ethylbenzene hydroxylase subunit beta/complex iron-sulfur molybdoenzyme family reductase subunit beta|nr:respiratory nitrate reductase subunit beta [Pseudomonadales bacterium]MDP6314899.1 respiratory nitrate reductase subunit beta [Pseudomonadales bacterium]MDP7316531.1 respiratory nitrate reductase subunit beta [Pseudomonadales bacterium]|tara:strand:- start:12736 stop:13782 length:1047 start_codon:yes stop_codon:yes gene_type:complete
MSSNENQPDHQLGMVMDLNKCIGCHTCTMACKRLWTKGDGMEHMWWNTVNTMPGQGTPKGWEQMGGGFKDGVAQPGHMPTKEEFGDAWEFNTKELFFEGGGAKGKLEIKGDQPDWGPNWDEDQGGGEYPDNYYFYLPRICNHCTHPACLEACPRKAIEKSKSNGIVTINADRCRGYRFCMEACPYKKIYLNHQTGITEKCIFCFPRIENGVAPACARQCPGRLRFVGYTDDMEAPIGKLIHKWKVAIPLHPEYGTEPNVFYVPPIAPSLLDKDGNLDDSKPRIPNDYLVSLFGPTVLDALVVLKEEMAKRKKGEASELMDILIAYDWKEMFGGFDRNPETIEWLEDSE